MKPGISFRSRQNIAMNNKKFCTIADVADLETNLREFRQHLHQYPELSNEETETAALVASRLRELGYEVTTGIGGHRGNEAWLRNTQYRHTCGYGCATHHRANGSAIHQ